MGYPFTDKYWEEHRAFILENMMGPNALRVTEELTSGLNIVSNMRVLDLGCGAGLSSILLAEKYDATVFAADLWISPSDNFSRFKSMGVDRKIVPLFADVTKGLPFSKEYFDLIICVDAYHYFGANQEMLPLLQTFIRPGGYIAVAVPGLKKEFTNNKTPEELAPFLPDNHNFHSLSWWTDLWGSTAGTKLDNCREMDCHRLAWDEWLQCPNPYAIEDIEMMKTENGQFFNHVQMIAERI